MSKVEQVKVATIGIGLGGANIAQAFTAKLGGTIGLINSSDQDMSTAGVREANNQCLIQVNGRTSGVGRDRALSGKAFGIYASKIAAFIVAKCLEAEAEIVFVCASSGGGTGSGLIPYIMSLVFTTDFEARFEGKKLPIFFAVVATPDTNEGVKSQQNTVELLRNFNTMITEKKIGRFLLISNQFGVHVKQDGAKYARINEFSVGLVARYLLNYGSSRQGCLDRADRFVGLDIPGIHAFFTFGDNGNHDSPFILPEGAHVTSALSEVPEQFIVSEALNRWGLNVGESFKGYYSAQDEMSPIVHLAGFQNFSKLSERFANQVQLSLARATEAKSVNESQGVGLNAISEVRSSLAKEYKAGTISMDDIGSFD